MLCDGDATATREGWWRHPVVCEQCRRALDELAAVRRAPHEHEGLPYAHASPGPEVDYRLQPGRDSGYRGADMASDVDWSEEPGRGTAAWGDGGYGTGEGRLHPHGFHHRPDPRAA